jgi:hypothetical protein
MAARRGIELHEFAHHAIRMGIKLPKVKKTLNQYVNDAVEFRMFVEVCLYYSANCFGHADTISFYNNVLRVHDLKSGMHTASMHQLEVYAAIFCLEYGISPYEITTILRIYQSNEVRESEPHPDLLMGIMDKIIDFDKKIDLLKESGEW